VQRQYSGTAGRIENRHLLLSISLIVGRDRLGEDQREVGQRGHEAEGVAASTVRRTGT
jgi:hypothetical protein